MKYKLMAVFTLVALLAVTLAAVVGAQENSSATELSVPKESLIAGNTQGERAVSSTEAESAVYIIQLTDAPIASYRGGIAGLEATNPAARGEVKLDADSPASKAYESYLDAQHASFISAAESLLGRDLNVLFTYKHAFNGMAIEMTAVEAKRIAAMEGVQMVQREFTRYIQTDVGPQWIGADSIWNGDYFSHDFEAPLDGSQEVPPSGSPGTGLGVFSFNYDTSELFWNIAYTGVATVTAAHIHVAPRGVNGPVIINLGPPANPFVGSAVLTMEQATDLFNGNLYVNIHTTPFPGGEIRGQLDAGSRGEGVIAGIIDTGLNLDHPSFAEIGAIDHYSHTNPLGSGNFLGLCASDPGTWVCNDKLIGYYIFTGETTEDTDGHGSHTGSTTAGNLVTATMDITNTNPFSYITRISGVAPHANVIGYDGCTDGGGCPGAALVAAINQATADGVDVINYSIGGGTSDPWTDADALAFLSAADAGIVPVTSAGNSGPGPSTVGSPGDAPWMLTVGASTHNRAGLNAVINMTGGDTPPPGDLPGQSLGIPYGPAPIVYAGDFGDALCLNPFPAGTWTNGEIVVCDRGTNARVAKGFNVREGGAGGFVLANASAGESLNTDPHVIPAVHINFADGDALKTWLATGSGHMASIQGTVLDYSASNGDIMAGFSSRGPLVNTASDIIKPDVTAPGVDVLAAYRTGSGPAGDPAPWMDEFNFVSGTSMSSPHTAGAAALMRALHPDWSAAEIKSAIMSTAWTSTVLKEDGVTPADPFDMGAGRVDLSMAGNAGLVLDETTANFVAANPGIGGDPKTLNLASLANTECSGSCSWTRTVSSTLSVPMTWTVSVNSSFPVTVTPATFVLAPGGSQAIDVMADVSGEIPGNWLFGEVVLTPSAPTNQAKNNSDLNILLMLDDISAGDRNAYYDALTAAGYSWTEWDLDTQPFPTLGDLNAYDTLIYGDESTMVPDNAQMQIVADWLTSGGKSLFATSVDFLWDLENGTVGQGEHNLYLLFNTNYVGDYAGTGIASLDGVPGDIIGDGLSLTLVGAADSNGDYADEASGAPTGFLYGAGDVGSGRSALTHHEGANYKTVWLGVNFHNGLTNQSERDALMANILSFLDASAPSAAATAHLPMAVIPFAPAVISVSPDMIENSQPAGVVATVPLTISNLGGSDLNWSIFEGLQDASSLVDWFDDFDSYATGSQMHGQGGWKGWDNDPAFGAVVTDVQALSAPNSVDIVGASDLVHEYSGYDSGFWRYTAWQYVPTAFTGESYFILLNTYADGGPNNWSTQVHFNAAQDLVIADGVGSGSTLPLIRGQWVEIRVDIDLENDLQEFYYDGTLLYSGSWADGVSGGGALNIGAVDLFANGASSVYYDDLSLVEIVPDTCDVPNDAPWLSVSPASGTTPGGGDSMVDVSLDSTTLSMGVYTSTLCVSSDDPVTPLVQVPVTLTVTGDPPVMVVDPLALASTQTTDSQVTQTLTISNPGGGDLMWSIDEAASLGELLLPIRSTPVEAAQGNLISFGDFSLAAAAGVQPGLVDPVYKAPEGLITLTHSNSQSIGTGSVACSSDGGATTTDNEYWRTFVLQDFGITTGFEVVEVSFGIQNATGPGGTQPMDVNLYKFTDPNGPFTRANLTLIGTTAVTIADATATIEVVPVSGVLDAGDILAVELASPDLTGVGAFFVGSNNLGQTAPSYLSSVSCGLANPVDLGVIGFPDMHIVMNVTGQEILGPCDLPSDIPWLSVSPTSGTTLAGSSTDVDVVFDSTGMALGVYTGTLCVNGNDPINSLVEVPVTMTVESEVYGVSVTAIDAAMSGAPGETLTYTVAITNEGNGADTFTLDVSGEVWATSLEMTTVVIAAGDSTTVEVYVTVPAGAADGEMDVATVSATSISDPAATDSVDLTSTAVVVETDLFIYLPFMAKP